jgi:hypothetical protein
VTAHIQQWKKKEAGWFWKLRLKSTQARVLEVPGYEENDFLVTASAVVLALV